MPLARRLGMCSTGIVYRRPRVRFASVLWIGLVGGECGGDGSPGHTHDSGRGDGGMVGDGSFDAPPPCADDPERDDGVHCNGLEACVDGACAAGDLVDCDDGVECTADRCDEAAQECIHTGPDADADGHVDGACGGDDCDDTDV